MISFILNNQRIDTELPPGKVLLDFIRYEMHLMGTKAGCREGDCGACTVLEGHLEGDEVRYKSIVSCLTPLGNVHGKHIVTIEGLQKDQLSPVQQTIVNNAATQCGFCTPGFVMSLTAHSLAPEASDKEKTIAAISGNICRCTGYKSIEHAAEDLSSILEKKDTDDSLGWLIEQAFLPEYFRGIAARLKAIETFDKNQPKGIPVGGGTDLFVQKAARLHHADLQFMKASESSQQIDFIGDRCLMGAEVTPSLMMQNEQLQNYFPHLNEHFKLISSEPIRNMGTIAGNIINASPIADLVIFFLALDARLHLNRNGNIRQIPLREFYTGYKQTRLEQGEIIEKIEFNLPAEKDAFNFEKVSKRQHLDIASVNSAMLIRTEGDTIVQAHLSAGGVFAFPFYAQKTVDFLQGKTINDQNLLEAARILQNEIAPISDIRGSKTYKSLLLRQLFFAHFVELFPNLIAIDSLLKKIAS
jgi:xanthine dehydrogenase small subunit